MLQKLKNKLLDICSLKYIVKFFIIAAVCADNQNAKHSVFSETNSLFMRSTGFDAYVSNQWRRLGQKVKVGGKMRL